NGLAAAITLARAGLAVEVQEAEDQFGGCLRSAELTLPGFVHDVCASIHPLGAAAPVLRMLELDVDWIHPEAPAAHPLDDGREVLLERSLPATAAGLGRDEVSYGRLVGPLVEAWREVEGVFLGPFPISRRALLRLADRLGARALTAAMRAALSPARTLAEGHFAEERTRAWFAGHAAHSMLPLERRPSAGFALALTVLGHAVGWPFPRGGSQWVADALAAKLRELGGEIRTSSTVEWLPVADLVVADVVPRELLRLARGRLPERYARGLRSYRHGPGALQLDWAPDGPPPWSAAGCRRAGAVHPGGSPAECSASAWAAWRRRPAEEPGRRRPRNVRLLGGAGRAEGSRAGVGSARARHRLGDDLGAGDRRRDARACTGDLRVGPIREPGRTCRRAVAAGGPTPGTAAVEARRPSAEDRLRRRQVVPRRGRAGNRGG